MIFLAGISATGKTRAASRLAATCDFIHLRASQLLAAAGRPISHLTKSQAMENQRELLRIIEPLSNGKNVLFDGHATVDTNEGPMEIPDWFFDEANLQKVICLVDDPTNIAERWVKRGGKAATPSEIEVAQDMEVSTARRQAQRLGIPFLELGGHDYPALRRAVSQEQI